MNRGIIAGCSTLALMLSASGGEVFAQSDTQSAGLEEITVTARKRDESLLQIPVAVTAFTAAKIEKLGITDLDKVADFTPSFQFRSGFNLTGGRSQQQLYVRGINSTSVFVDGAIIGRGLYDNIGDVERVEVLKGPQSAYFGRATFAGAINLVTKVPSNEFKASFDALYGSYNWYDIHGSVEGPVIEDKLTARVTLRAYAKDGDYRNAGSARKRSRRRVNQKLFHQHPLYTDRKSLCQTLRHILV